MFHVENAQPSEPGACEVKITLAFHDLYPLQTYFYGGELPPIMLLVYINDISNGLALSVKLFADDMKIYRVLNFEKLVAQRLVTC